MFQHDQSYAPSSRGARGGQVYIGEAAATARRHYQRVRLWAGLAQLWARLARRRRTLFDLADVASTVAIRSRRAAGTRPVLVSQIRGSEGRATEFDATFAPLQSHTRERWIGVATLLQLGEALPAVSLVQIGDVYFVRDGHHRVSAARALGHAYIDASVTVWDVVGALPWECAGLCAPLQQPA